MAQISKPIPVNIMVFNPNVGNGSKTKEVPLLDSRRVGNDWQYKVNSHFVPEMYVDPILKLSIGKLDFTKNDGDCKLIKGKGINAVRYVRQSKFECFIGFVGLGNHFLDQFTGLILVPSEKSITSGTLLEIQIRASQNGEVYSSGEVSEDVKFCNDLLSWLSSTLEASLGKYPTNTVLCINYKTFQP